MGKLINTLIIAGVCVVVVGIGAYFILGTDILHKEAKGLILYGDEIQISDNEKVAETKKDYSYKMKAKEANEEFIIIKETDAKELQEKGLLMEVRGQGKVTEFTDKHS